MKQIFKNYLTTFVKNWVQTIGTILFIVMMTTIVIGMLASPLQISSKIKNFDRNNIKFNNYVASPKAKYTSDFLYTYVYEGKNYVVEDEAGNKIDIIDQNNPDTGVISETFKKYINDEISTKNFKNDYELKEYVGSTVEKGINSFTNGALTNTGLELQITDSNKKINEDNLDIVLNDLIEILSKDITISKNNGYSENESNIKAFAKISEFFTNNGLTLDLNTTKTISNPINIIRDQLVQQLDSKVANKKLELLGFQIFNADMYEVLSEPKCAYDFKNFVTFGTLVNTNNRNAFDKENNKFNFEFNSEKNYYFSKTTTESLFPSFAIELKTIDSENGPNQLQLESGRRVKKTSIKDIVKNNAIPEIVLSSSYMSKNNLKIGDIIEIPEGKEYNNVIKQMSPIDSMFTDKMKFKIVGSGEKFDDVVPGTKFIPFLEDIKDYSIAYIDNDVFSYIRNSRWSYSSEKSNSFWSMIRTKNNVENLNIEKAFTANEIKSIGIFKSSNQQFLKASDSKTVTSLNNLKIQVIIYIILGVVVLLLAFIFINFTIKKELNETRKQIGIFKSFGYKISELSWIFAIKTFISILGGMIIGYIVSIPLQLYNASSYDSSIMFNFQHIYGNAGFIAVILLAIPLLFLGISYGLTLLYLKEPTLSLLSNGSKISKFNLKPSFLIRYLSKKGKGFNYRLQRSFVRRGIGKFIVVQTLFAFASLTFTLMFGAQTLMYSMVNQGFGVLKQEVDHSFSWRNQNEIGIDYEKTKYNIDDIDKYKARDFSYYEYGSEKELKDVLNENKATSDSRFRINYLISAISNEFDKNTDNALNMLMPTIFYHDKFGSGNNVNPQTGPQKLTDPNYYLNWIFTFKISELTNNETNKIKNNEKVYFKDLEDFVKNNPNSRIDLSGLMNDDQSQIEELQKEFLNTLFGLSDSNEQGLKNNLFLSDVTKIISLQLMESYVDNAVDKELKSNFTPNAAGKFKDADIDKAIKAVKNKYIVRDFSPNKQKYWGINNNPLVDMKEMVSEENGNGSKPSGKNDSGLSLSKLSPETISLIMSAMMLGYNDEDVNKMPTMTVNELFFNKEKEILSYELPIEGVDDDRTSGSYLKMFDAKEAKYGDFNKLFNHTGVSDDTYKHLADNVEADNVVNAVIPYGLSKAYDLGIGDYLTAYTKTKSKQEIKLKVIGINKDISFTLGLGWPIDVDYNAFRQKFFDSELNNLIDQSGPIFNAMYSEEPMLEGKINLKDLAGSINSMKYMGKNLSLSINKDSSVFGSIFNGMMDFTKLLNLKIDSGVRLVTNPNIASTSFTSSVVPYNIMRQGVDVTVDTVNNILVLFMILQAVILLIILVVVMNIIVEESTPIILTLRSLGYKNKDINWIVMGSYITGAFISFIIAYVLSLVIWAVFLQVAGELWHIYVFMSFSWKAPVITFLVIFSILFIGWFVSNWKVNKTPLTLVTGFN